MSGLATRVTYAQVAALREAAGSEREKRMQRWLSQIAGAPAVVEWPTGRPRPARLSGEGVQISRVLPRERVLALHAAARSCRVTVPAFLFSVLQALLHVKTRRRELLVGAVSLGRNNPAWLEVVGPLFNMLPVRSSIAPGCTFEQLAQRTGMALIETMVEDQIGFAEIIQRGHVPTTLDRSPLVQFLFNYIPKQGVGDGANAGVTQIDVDWGTATFDVDVSARERGDDLVLTVKRSTDALDEGEGAAFIAAFDGLLACVVEDPRTVPPAARRAGAPAGQRGLLEERARGRPERGPPRDRRALFCEQFRLRAIAVRSPGPLRGRAAEDCEAQRGAADFGLPRGLCRAPAASFGPERSGPGFLASLESERKLEAAAGLPGTFTMVRANMADNPTFEELVVRMARKYAAAVVHQPLSVSEAFGSAQRDESESGIGVLLAYHRRARGGEGHAGRAAVPSPECGVVLDIEHGESAISGAFTCEPGLLTADAIHRWKARFLALVASAAENPGERISRLDLLPGRGDADPLRVECHRGRLFKGHVRS